MKRVKEVNETFLEYKKKGLFNQYIYDNYIRDRYHISKATFYEYLGIPYKRLIKELEEKKKGYEQRNPMLFHNE